MSPSASAACSAARPEWAATGLGPREQWPHALRLTVDILLNAPLPMLLAWGDGPVVVYNDAYARIAGPRHAPAPGASVPAIWPAPLAAGRSAYDAAMHGETGLLPAQTLSFAGAHGPEQRDYDLYFTPIRDEQDAVRGVLCAVAPGTAPHNAGLAGAMRILVVEDNLDSQYLVCEMLKAFGHEADGVAHAEGALAMLAGGQYEVLFSDVSLPGMSGVELARQALRAQPALKVIFASGYGDAMLRHVEFPYLSLQKPYELDQLQGALATLSEQLRGKP